MLFYLIQYLEQTFHPPGFQVFQFIMVRATLAAITALFIAMVVGRSLINWLGERQLQEQIREGIDAGAVSHAHKAGTPTMGGVIILMSILISSALWAPVKNTYIWLALLAIAWMGAIGFGDDYIKTILKNKEGLPPFVKIAAQVGIGLIVGGVLYFHPQFSDIHTFTTLPFVKGRVVDYYFFDQWLGTFDFGWLIYLPVAVFIMTAVTNAVNLTDGLDGLTSGVTAFVSGGLVILCYVAGNRLVSDYLNTMYLPGTGELTIVAASMTAACFGFLWYNGYPATVFMGDTGSLALGAAVGALTLMIRKELMLPLLGAVYFLEALSVILQTTYFKYSRRRTGRGVRLFLMAPLHHHFEAKGTHEAKIVTRFWIVTAVAVVATILTLRIR